MPLVLLIVFMFVAFGLTTFFRRWIDVPVLIAVAIGCAVNANLFNPLTAPIVVEPFTFSIEIVLYTLFMYTLVVRMLDYGNVQARTMMLTSIAAIIISAFIELMANLMMQKALVDSFKAFSVYLVSSFGTIVGAWVMVWIANLLHKKNVSCYIILPITIAVSSIIHSVIFYGGIALINWEASAYTVYNALGTMMGKAVCIGLCILCYFINKNYWQPLNLVEKEEINNDNESK